MPGSKQFILEAQERSIMRGYENRKGIATSKFDKVVVEYLATKTDEEKISLVIYQCWAKSSRC